MSGFDLSGRIALVTGGGTGIGLGISRALAEAGATLVLAGRRLEVTRAAAAELSGAEAVALDVTDRGAIDSVITAVQQRHGRIDILVTSAETNRHLPTLDYDEASWDAVIDTNLKGAFFCAQSAARAMRPNGWGRIIHVGSVAATLASCCRAAIARARRGLCSSTR